MTLNKIGQIWNNLNLSNAKSTLQIRKYVRIFNQALEFKNTQKYQIHWKITVRNVFRPTTKINFLNSWGKNIRVCQESSIKSTKKNWFCGGNTALKHSAVRKFKALVYIFRIFILWNRNKSRCNTRNGWKLTSSKHLNDLRVMQNSIIEMFPAMCMRFAIMDACKLMILKLTNCAKMNHVSGV